MTEEKRNALRERKEAFLKKALQISDAAAEIEPYPVLDGLENGWKDNAERKLQNLSAELYKLTSALISWNREVDHV